MRRLFTPAAWVLGLLLVLLGFLASSKTPLPGEDGFLDWLQGFNTGWVTSLMEGTSYLGDLIPAIISVAVIVVALLLYRRWREALLVALTPTVSTAVSYLLKELTDRPRPFEPFTGSGNSFPSGHTTYVASLAGIVWYLVPHVLPRRGAILAIRGAMLLFVALTAISRMYLGVHWPSDVAGGLLLAGLCVAAAARWHGGRTLSEANDAGTS